MREIKFRGIKISDKKWIIGDLNFVDGKPFIFNREGQELNSPDHYEVIPDTVGEFTGLKNYKGIEIYEGDIVDSAIFGKGVIKHDAYTSSFIVQWNKKHEAPITHATKSEIIGNIHEK